MSSLSFLAGRIIEDLQVVKMPRMARAIRRDKRRDAFYENILKNAQINFDNKEIQDIQKGVRTYLERLTTRMNEGHALKISYIQPCGSMEENSSILKEEMPYYYAETVDTKYIELDYLAILDTPDDIRLDEGCPGCRTSYSWLTDNIFQPDLFNDERFDQELQSTAKGLCDCFSRRTSNQVLDSYGFDGCPSCIVDMDTGYLQLIGDYTIYNPYSLLLLWTSYASSLSNYNCYSLPVHATQPIKYLPVHIDFLLAIQISGEQIDRSYPLFMVSKWCSYCVGFGRLSGCLGEIEYFRKKVSEKHKKSYIILKFISQFSLYIHKYHLKVILFHHCETCSDTSEDYTICVLSILRELSQSYETSVLMSFLGNVNLLETFFAHTWKGGWDRKIYEPNNLIKSLYKPLELKYGKPFYYFLRNIDMSRAMR